MPFEQAMKSERLAGYGHALATTTAPTLRAKLFLGETAPHTRVLPGDQGPFKALAANLAKAADGLGRVHLGCGRTRRSSGKEQLRVFFTTLRSVNPFHQCGSSPQRKPGCPEDFQELTGNVPREYRPVGG